MRIEPTNEAIAQLEKRLQPGDPLIKLIYDIEGCGCAVDGIAQLWQVDRRLPEDTAGYDGAVTILYDSRQEVFFEDRLKLDYDERRNGFKLTGDGQIYGSNLRILDKRGSEF